MGLARSHNCIDSLREWSRQSIQSKLPVVSTLQYTADGWYRASEVIPAQP